MRVYPKISSALTTLVTVWLLIGNSIAKSGADEAAPADDSHSVHERYWWLDEIRTVSQALSRAREGQVATWPQMSVEAGWATLPLPKVTTPVRTDGKLDEPAWQEATSLPVGPLFADWRGGPFMLQLSACRDDAKFYIAIRSPRDLSTLATGVLFEIAGEPYRIAQPAADIKGGVIRKDSTGQTIELALPLPKEAIQLKFHPELVRRSDSRQSDLHYLGLDKHKGPVWLDPMTIKLVAAPDVIRFKDVTSNPQGIQLSYKLRAGSRQPKTRVIDLRPTAS